MIHVSPGNQTERRANYVSVPAGPFELTKLSAQVSVLMADKKNCPRPESHSIAASYQNKGTLKTLGNIIKHRGFGGLYTGFSLHLSMLPVSLLGTWLEVFCWAGRRRRLTER